MDCSSMGFPQSHSLLWVQPSAPVWGSPWARGGILPHWWSPWAAGGHLTTDCRGVSVLMHFLPSFLTDLGLCVSHVRLLSKRKRAHPTGFSPLKDVIREVLSLLLIGSALAKGGSGLQLGDHLEGSYRRHTQSSLVCYQYPTRHKPNTPSKLEAKPQNPS